MSNDIQIMKNMLAYILVSWCVMKLLFHDVSFFSPNIAAITQTTLILQEILTEHSTSTFVGFFSKEGLCQSQNLSKLMN